MYFRELLNTLRPDKLKDIARVNNIQGFSKLSKHYLVDLIDQNLYPNKSSLAPVFRSIPDFQKYLLVILSKNPDGVCSFNDLKEEFMESYSKLAYFIAVSNLGLLAFIFHIKTNLLIPSDFLCYIREFAEDVNILAGPLEGLEELEHLAEEADVTIYVNDKLSPEEFIEKERILRTYEKELRALPKNPNIIYFNRTGPSQRVLEREMTLYYIINGYINREK